MNYQSIQEERNRLINLLEQFRDKPLDAESLASLNRCIERIREGRFRIAVFGDFSNGKSTLLNALMELKEEILVVDELPSTAAVTVLQAPPSAELDRKAKISFHDPAREPIIIPMEESKSYSAKQRAQDGSAEDDRVEDDVAEVRIYLRSPLLENGVEIIDTPGLNSTYKKHTAITRGIMERADATIFLFDYAQTGKSSELETIHFLSDYLRKAFLVVNQIDNAFVYTDPEDRIYNVCEDLRQKLTEKQIRLGDKEIYPISAKLAFQAHIREDAQLLETSRIEDLTNALQVYLCSPEFQQDKLYTPLKKLRQELNHILSQNMERIAAANNSANENQRLLKAAEDALKAERRRAKEFSEAVRVKLNGVFRTSESKFTDKAETIREEILGTIESHNTAYAIRYYQSGGGDYRAEVMNGMLSVWNNTTKSIVREVLQVLSEELSAFDEDGTSGMEIPAARLAEMTMESLSTGLYAPEETFQVDFSEIEAMRKKQAELEKKLEACVGMIAAYKKNAAKRDEARTEYNRLQREMADLKNDIAENRRRKAGIQNDCYQEEFIRQEDRDGFLGRIGEWLVGKRRVKDTRMVEDSTRADKTRGELGQLIQAQVDDQEKLRKKIDENRQIIFEGEELDCLLDEALQNQADLREDRLQMRLRIDQRQIEVEDMQVQIYQEKMKKQVSDAMEDFVEQAESSLTAIRQRVVSFAVELLRDSEQLRRYEARRNELQKLTIASDEERQVQAAQLLCTNRTIQQIIETLTPYEVQEGRD